MAGQLKKFQMVGFQGWKGLTKRNHLAAIGQESPQKASELMVQLLAFYRGKTLETFLSRFPVKYFDDDSEYYWDVVGSTKRNIPLVEARKIDGTVVTDKEEMIGAGTEPFYLVFAEDWFADGEVIFGNLNQVYPFRVLGNARMEGTNAVYKVELMGGNTVGVPGERLMAGERFSVGFAPVERELSRKVGDIRFSTPVAMRNEWTTLRIQHKVPGSMLNKKLAFGIPVIEETKSGDKVRTIKNMWMHEVDWQFEQQWQDYKNMAAAWGTSNRNSNGEYMNFGKSGEVIRMGDGLFAQMEVANTQYYNDFSLKLLEDSLLELFSGKVGFQDRKVILRTGERGAMQFNKAVRDTVSGWTNFTLNGDALGVVSKTNSPLHSNALKAGYQFTEYEAPNGLRISLEVDPFYDDPVHNKIMHPNGGVASSYRYDILDMGSMNQPNIFFTKIKGQEEIKGYESGFRNPFTGQVNIENMSHDEDSATIHKYTNFGVCVLDPTRTMSIIPAVLQG